jgi:hypothetical protein
MKFRIPENLITDPVAKLPGMAGGEKKIELVLQTSRGNGRRDGGTERVVSTCRRIRSHKDSALCLRSFLASA